MSARFLLALAGLLVLGVVAAAAVGLLNALAAQPFYAVAGALLAAGFYLSPMLARRLLARLAADATPTALSLGAGGVAAITALLGLGAFVLSASLVNDAYVDAVWPLFFPALPLMAFLAGLGRYGYLELMRWVRAEADDEAGDR
ncbi:MAG TPA: hypothetical protein VLA56_21420 [Pseudomonadales bacterium]|nr:hypothetical protein [Pseudomonadales bacterium]